MASTEIPRVDDTDLDRDDLVEAAEELDIKDHESLDDQELFEELGRRLGEIDDAASEDEVDDGAEGSDEPTAEATSATDDDAAGAPTPDQIREELQGLTRDQVRSELRDLGLPVSGSKSELVERLEAARLEAAEAAEDVTDDATEATEEATDQATAATDEATDQASEATDHVADAAERTSESAAEVTPDREAARDEDEYRVEDDERDNIAPILDLELGPLALDVLGLDIHLNRVHAVLVANPDPKHALLGKLLSGVSRITGKLGLHAAVDTVADGVEQVVDVLPTPDTEQGGGDEEAGDEEAETPAPDSARDGGEEEDPQGDDSESALGRVRSRITGTARAAKDLVGHATDAGGSAKDATTDVVTSGGKAKAAKATKDAFKSAKAAGSSAKNVVTGRR